MDKLGVFHANQTSMCLDPHHAFMLCGHLKGRAGLSALVCDVYCDFGPFPFAILGQVWYLIVSIPDPCCLSYFLCPHIF